MTNSLSSGTLKRSLNSLATIGVCALLAATQPSCMPPTAEDFATQAQNSTNVPMVNRGFELGNLAAWTTAGDVQYSSTNPHSGNGCARVGNSVASTGTHTLSRSFTVPATGMTILSLWALFNARDPQPGDYQRASILANDGTVLETIFNTTPSNTQSWNSFSIDLTPYANQSVTLQLRVNATAASPATYMRVDDILLANTAGQLSAFVGLTSGDIFVPAPFVNSTPVTRISAYEDGNFIYGLRLWWGEQSVMYGTTNNLDPNEFIPPVPINRIVAVRNSGMLRGLEITAGFVPTMYIGGSGSAMQKVVLFDGPNLQWTNLLAYSKPVTGVQVLSGLQAVYQ